MIERNLLVHKLDELLPQQEVPDDPSNNGLQVEGAPKVERAVFGVDACLALFEKAIELGSSFIFVHHGLSWGGGISYFTGVEGRRLKTLLANDVSLYASHLPLDMHPELGHNAVLARRLGIESPSPFFEYEGVRIGCGGPLPEPTNARRLRDRLNSELHTQCTLIGEPDRRIRDIAIVSGLGADAVRKCAGAGYDCLLTGEMRHSEYHTARELGLCVIAAGHYRTEIPGVRAVMEWVREELDLECEFVDLPTNF
ncbi:MAG: Nif3-like dinuclear metal center hexameric protein [Planctomycetota bacterium]